MGEQAKQQPEQASWQRIYDECRLKECGVEFHKFISDPWGVLTRCGQFGAPASIANGFKPLLPKQAAVAKRLHNSERRQALHAVYFRITGRRLAH